MSEIGNVRRDLKKAYTLLRTWRAVGDAFGISGGMAYRIVEDKYEPKDAHIRVKLGLPAMAPAPVCRVCGEVHLAKRCPKRVERKPVRLFDMPVKSLRKMIDEREEW